MGLRTVRLLLWLPLAAFVVILGLVAGGLVRPHDPNIRSQMVDKPVPAFALPRVGGGTLTQAMLADGRPKLVNLFASWCVPCAAEAPQLDALRARGVPIVGVAIRDTDADLADFLKRYGDPYAVIARDDTAGLQVALGSSGVPESFLVDGRGVVRRQIIGDIRPEQVDEVASALADVR
ncbi:redoxin family protein [Sphingomonas sp.]|uniref:redoxin family protein n=1 Tax=Sphingomonas sp. TaxID=28214 RepID=UPI003B00ED20